MKETKKQLQFNLHLLKRAIHNLEWSLIYNDIDNENAQHYFNELKETIKETSKEFKKIETKTLINKIKIINKS